MDKTFTAGFYGTLLRQAFKVGLLLLVVLLAVVLPWGLHSYDCGTHEGKRPFNAALWSKSYDRGSCRANEMGFEARQQIPLGSTPEYVKKHLGEPSEVWDGPAAAARESIGG